MRAKLRVGVRGNTVVVWMPDGSHFSKPIPEGMSDEQAIVETLALLSRSGTPAEEQN